METRLPSRAAQSQPHRRHLCGPPAAGHLEQLMGYCVMTGLCTTGQVSLHIYP